MGISFCSVTDDGLVAGCRRESSGAFRQDANALGPIYYHWLGEGQGPSGIPFTPVDREPAPPAPPRATEDILDKVYRDLLALCCLTDKHYQALSARGLSIDVIDRNGYGTLSLAKVDKVAAALIERHGPDILRTVPGFKPGPDGSIVLWSVAGLLIPVRDRLGRVVALKCRPDFDRGSKYVWVSMAGKGGPTSGAPIHHPVGTPVTSDSVRLVEGPLKADVVTDLDPDIPTIAMPGASSIAKAIPALLAMSARRVVIALDSDWREKKMVAWGLARAIGACREVGLEIAIEDWDEALGKGPDDLRQAGHRPRLVEGLAVDDILAEAARAAEDTSLFDDGRLDDDPATLPFPTLAPPALDADLDLIHDAIAIGARAIMTRPLIEAARRIREADALEFSRLKIDLKSVKGLSIRDFDRAVGSPPSPPNGSSVRGANHKFTDLGNARRLVDRHGENIRYCHSYGDWLSWQGDRWSINSDGEISRLVIDTVEALEDEASGLTGRLANECLDWSIESQCASRLEACERVARSDVRVRTLVDQLDADPWAFNVLNGTLDLKTGQIKPHDKADLLTKLAPVKHDPEATCPSWLKFLDEISVGRPELVGFLQRVIGYASTGVIREHILVILHGGGGNGKGTFLEVVQRILGDYATSIPPSTLLSSDGNQHPTGLTDLEGRRLVSTEEVSEGDALDEALVKRLTGGNPIRARKMGKDFYQFSPTHKIMMATNPRPEIRGTDEGIWRRVKMVPFDAHFDQSSGPTSKTIKADLSLVDKLMIEASGILNWILAGVRDWDQGGLAEPDVVRAAVDDYRDDQDTFRFFADDNLVPDPRASTSLIDLYKCYTDWCEKMRFRPLGIRRFGNALRALGYQKDPDKAAAHRLGVRLPLARTASGRLDF